MSKYRISIADKTYEMEIERMDEVAVTMEKPAGTTWIQDTDTNSSVHAGQTIGESASKKTFNARNTVYSPMPGTIVRLYAKNGDMVRRGEVILVLEAMKMENEITSPADGIVSGLNVIEKQAVQGGTILCEIDE